MNKQEKITSEDIDLIKRMIRELNWLTLVIIIIVAIVSIILFYADISNKITYIILVNVSAIPIYFLFLKELKAVKDDLANGVKYIISGTITDITSARGQNFVHVDKTDYAVPHKPQIDFNIGENIRIEISPICKHVFRIIKIEEIEN